MSLSHRHWRISTFSSGGNCVEVRHEEEEDILVRHSQHPDGPTLKFNRGEWAAFLAGVRNSEFDLADSPLIQSEGL